MILKSLDSDNLQERLKKSLKALGLRCPWRHIPLKEEDYVKMKTLRAPALKGKQSKQWTVKGTRPIYRQPIRPVINGAIIRAIGLNSRTKEQSLELFLTLKGSTKKKSLMMTLERLLSFINTKIPRDTRRLARGLIPVRRMAKHTKCSAKFARQKGDVPSILLDTWQRAHKTDSCSTENCVPQKVAPF